MKIICPTFSGSLNLFTENGEISCEYQYGISNEVLPGRTATVSVREGHLLLIRNLKEETSLQRKMKRMLLEGKQPGSARGELVRPFV